MVDKPKNIGVEPLDGEDEDIYSYRVGTNVFSFLGNNTKFIKSRPPPTYIDYNEYEVACK